MSERKTKLAEYTARAMRGAMEGVFRSRPGKVVKWDASKQRADVQPLIQIPYKDAEGDRQVESAAIVTCVPLIFPGAGPVRITFPISDGKLQIEGETVAATTGLLVWCDCSLDKWLSGRGGEVDPEFDHRDGHNDAVFFAGMNPFGNPLGDVPTDYMSIGFDGGMQIKLEKTLVTVGDKNAIQTQFVALANLVDQNYQALKGELDAVALAANTHKHSFPVIGTSSVADTPYTNGYTVTDTSAKNLKAEQ